MIAGTIDTRAYSDTDARRDVWRALEVHDRTITAFHRLVYHARHTWSTTHFEGVPVLKYPTDLWTYHEWIRLLKPTLIIETGTGFGGSALYFARQLDALGAGHVITMDPDVKPNRPQHPRITYLDGSSMEAVNWAIVRGVIDAGNGRDQVMVVLDSDHASAHVRAELDAYAPLVSRGQLLVVEDTNLSDPDLCDGLDGPAHALRSWLPQHPEFKPEVLCERHLVSFFPGGWLRRIA